MEREIITTSLMERHRHLSLHNEICGAQDRTKKVAERKVVPQYPQIMLRSVDSPQDRLQSVNTLPRSTTIIVERGIAQRGLRSVERESTSTKGIAEFSPP